MEALHVEVAGKLLFSKDLLPAVSNTYDLKEGWKERMQPNQGELGVSEPEYFIGEAVGNL